MTYDPDTHGDYQRDHMLDQKCEIHSLDRALDKANAELEEARALAEKYRNYHDGKLGFCRPEHWLPWEIEAMDKEDAIAAFPKNRPK